ncbi:MAG: proline dehydrogenase family protein, partial [Phycisphaerae bacterium]|nr:proline dehydrogenase family protein [Phycisphaerae bacterium]
MSLFNRMIVTLMPVVPKIIVKQVAKRYVAGETLVDAVRTARALNAEGAMCTVDVLGEEVFEKSRAGEFAEQYLRVFDAIKREELDANVSIKLSMLGLKLGEDFCIGNIDKIFATAKANNNFVRIDMEDHTCTDATIRVYNEMQKRYGNTGIVFQAYLRRTIADIANLPKEKPNVRICKGIYIEPRNI